MPAKSTMAFTLRGEGSETLELDIYDVIADSLWRGVSAKTVRDQLKSARGGAKRVKLTINSAGGVVTEGVAIYNELISLKAAVDVHITGVAASIASVIAMAGDTVTMGAGAFLMIHDPWGAAYGRESDFRSYAEQLAKNKAEIIGIYAAKTGQSADRIRKWMAAETWFTGAEAKELGFATAIIEPKRSAEAETDASESRAFAQVYACLDPERFTNLPAPIAAWLSARDVEAAAQIITEALPPPEPVSPPVGRIEPAPQEFPMAIPKFLALALSVPESTDESAVQARISELAKLEASTGKTGGAALGVVEAWKGAHEELPAVKAERDTLKVKVDESDAREKAAQIEASIVKAKAENKLMPAQESKLRALVTNGLDLAGVQAFCDMLEPHAARAEVKPPKTDPLSDFIKRPVTASGGTPTPRVAGEMRYEDYTPDQLSAMRANNELSTEAYSQLRASWEERGKPRVNLGSTAA